MSKYILNFIIFFVVLGLGVLAYQLWFAPSEESMPSNVEIDIENLNNNVENLEIEVESLKNNAENVETEEKNQNNNMENNIEGLEIEILKEGAGEEAKDGDNVSVHYTGTLVDGTKFDSSVDRGQPFQFGLGAGQVIQGWDLGVKGMKVGEKRKLTIAPELGYGNADMGSIPPNSTLIFEVELLGIVSE